MKKQLLILTVLMILLGACSRQGTVTNEEENRGSIQFSYSLVSNSLKKFTATIDEARFVRLSLVDSADSAIYTDTIMPLAIPSQLLTEPLVLWNGAYKIVKYEVLDSSEAVIFRTPDASSSLAQLVNDPLSIDFDVLEDSANVIRPEVLRVQGHDPEDFGFPYYGIDEVKTIFMELAALYFNTTTNAWQLTDADVQVNVNDESGQSRTFNYTIGDSVSYIRLLDVPDSNYVITVGKSGIDTVEQTLTYEQVKSHTESTENFLPLKILLGQ